MPCYFRGVRVLVCGSRHLTRRWLAIIRERLEKYGATEVVEGGATGADALAREAAEGLGLPVRSFPADWSRGKRAGPERNARMLVEGRPAEVWAFHADAALGKGTADMVRKARAAGVPVRVHVEAEV